MTKCNCPAANLLRELCDADRALRGTSPGKGIGPDAHSCAKDRLSFAWQAARHWLREREAEEGEKK